MSEHLESLKVNHCRISTFKVEGKHYLRLLQLNGINSLENFYFEEKPDSLEVVSLGNIEISWEVIHEVIGSASLIQNLSLLHIDGVDFETISTSFPLLKKLSISYPKATVNLSDRLQFATLGILEIEWDEADQHFAKWVEKLILKCPELFECVVTGFISKISSDKLCSNMQSASMLYERFRDVKFEKVRFTVTMQCLGVIGGHVESARGFKGTISKNNGACGQYVANVIILAKKVALHHL
ncbi:F-box/LRR-repeat protein At1g67190-like [Apium graveolens]|uniref:F-box/LRR-repeat protein At1g67190-like n=1 Tax=Apium graveolens TaxID=4045 RepID=UPI003D798793